MKNSSVSEKSKGFLVFAFDTDEISYVKIADKTSSLIAKFTGLPVTLVTDVHSIKPKFKYDCVIEIENNKQNTRTINGQEKSWRNHGRSLAYDLSPYESTILVDCDLVVMDDSLAKFAESVIDYRLVFNSRDFRNQIFSKMGSSNALPFVWATVVMFNRCESTKLYFDLVKRIERNYAYYKTLFTGSGTYRNDYVFAIADIILKGYAVDYTSGIPWNMLTAVDDINDMTVQKSFIAVKQTDTASVIPRQPLHIMDKNFLMSSNFERFVEELLNE